MAAQQSQELRDYWQCETLPNYTEDQLVFLDELALNERTGDRKMGYAPPGITPRMKRYLKYMERYSVLPAYTIKGYIAAITFQGGITTEIFKEFLEFHLLPLCNSYPGP